MDAIIIEGLKVDTVIGCLDWERQILQPLLLDLVVHTNLTQASESDALQDTLNYALICQAASETIQQAKPQLIEHAAQLVLQQLFATFEPIESIKITIRKPAIIAQANSVGIRLERHRHDFCTRLGE